MAYTFQRNDRRVLISGRFPSKLDSRGQVREFLRDLGAPGGDAAAYLDSLDLLEPLQPDIWLPTSPVNGQNANLYDDGWRDVIERNRKAIRESDRR